MNAMSKLMEDLGFIGSFELPTHRFFTPTDLFWQELEKHRDKSIIDMGAGAGDLVIEGRARQFRMTGCDIARRPGVDPMVVHMFDAMRFPLSDRCFALLCRPSHNGWADEAVKNALSQNCSVAYVGLHKNVEIDLGRSLVSKAAKPIKKVGVEGESMWIWTP